MARQFSASRGRGRIVSGERRLTRWLAAIPTENTLAAASTPVLVSVLNAAALALRPFTVIRTRGVFGVRSDQEAANEDFSASLACAVVSEEASAIGVTAIPTPETDRDSDLFYVFESLAGFLDTGTGSDNQWMQFDSKAMRKVNSGQDLVTVIETSTISSGAIVHVSFRFLIKLH